MIDNHHDVQRLADACTREAARLRQEAEQATTDAEFIRFLERARDYDDRAAVYGKSVQPGSRFS